MHESEINLSENSIEGKYWIDGLPEAHLYNTASCILWDKSIKNW